jgi:hypothetical protein
LYQISFNEIGKKIYARNRKLLLDDLEEAIIQMYDFFKSKKYGELSSADKEIYHYLFNNISEVSEKEIIKESIILLTNERYGVKHCLSYPAEKFCRYTTDALCGRHIPTYKARIRLGSFEEVNCEHCKLAILKYRGENVKRQKNKKGKIYRGENWYLK